MNKFLLAANPKTAPVVYRTLSADDFEAYKDIRIEALTGIDRHFFTANPTEEIARTDSEWRVVCGGTINKTVVGAFCENELVGIMSATRSKDDPTGNTIYYSAEYVRPAFRENGLAGEMILLRDIWASNHGCNRATYTIRTNNPWLIKQLWNGAKIIKELNLRFADGLVAPIYLLERVIGNKLELQHEERQLTHITIKAARPSSPLLPPPPRVAGDAGSGESGAQTRDVIGA